MAEENTNKKDDIQQVTVVQETAETLLGDSSIPETAETTEAPRKKNERFGRKGERKSRREPRARPEFDQKIIDIRRVTRVAAGGRRFSFSVALVAGNRKGKVGVGTGKANDTSLAIEKALKNAKKNMIEVPLTSTMSIPYDVKAKYCSARVEIAPAKGKGVAAGSSVKDVVELAGINDVVAKLRSGTKNRLNNARVAIKALSMIR